MNNAYNKLHAMKNAWGEDRRRDKGDMEEGKEGNERREIIEGRLRG